jgi:peptidoglycan/xylan/chitin deacetylase (PgdA/CDA1 family)
MTRATGRPPGYGPSLPPGRRPPGLGSTAPRRVPPGLVTVAVAVAGILILVVAGVARAARPAAAVAASPGLAWRFSPAANTVTVRLTPGDGPSSRQILARSYLTVINEGNGRPSRRSGAGRMVQVPVPPGRQTRLLVHVKGPEPFHRILSVTAPPLLRVIRFRRTSGGLLLSLSSGLRRPRPESLCHEDVVSSPVPSEVEVARSPDACRAILRLTARNGEQAAVPVSVPALPEVPLYAFASPARRAIYITVDDGWTPSSRVLAIMRRTHLPVTAFLIQEAARQHLPYWRAFVRAGGTVGDHSVSHPDLAKLTLGQATVQWAQARQALGRWLGQAPLLGRPPYGDFDNTVLAAAHQSGLKALAGWSVTVGSDGIHTWDGQRLEPGEIVLLHWVPGLGRQLIWLLAAIHRQHLRPSPLTVTSFAGITPQRHSLGGD